jgi:hypothetical protein
MIKVIQITLQHAPLEDDPREWIMDFTATHEDGTRNHGSWNCESMDGCLYGLPLVIERLNNQETYA